MSEDNILNLLNLFAHMPGLVKEKNVKPKIEANLNEEDEEMPISNSNIEIDKLEQVNDVNGKENKNIEEKLFALKLGLSFYFKFKYLKFYYFSINFFKNYRKFDV